MGIEAHEAHRLELLKSTVQAGESSLKTLLLINGGAAVTVLAFLGNLLAKQPPSGFEANAAVQFSVPNFKSGLFRFTVGVALVGAGTVFRYLSLYASRVDYRPVELSCLVAAFVAGVASLWSFVLGCKWVVGAVW